MFLITTKAQVRYFSSRTVMAKRNGTGKLQHFNKIVTSNDEIYYNCIFSVLCDGRKVYLSFSGNQDDVNKKRFSPLAIFMNCQLLPLSFVNYLLLQF